MLEGPCKCQMSLGAMGEQLLCPWRPVHLLVDYVSAMSLLLRDFGEQLLCLPGSLCICAVYLAISAGTPAPSSVSFEVKKVAAAGTSLEAAQQTVHQHLLCGPLAMHAAGDLGEADAFDVVAPAALLAHTSHPY